MIHACLGSLSTEDETGGRTTGPCRDVRPRRHRSAGTEPRTSCVRRSREPSPKILLIWLRLPWSLGAVSPALGEGLGCLAGSQLRSGIGLGPATRVEASRLCRSYRPQASLRMRRPPVKRIGSDVGDRYALRIGSLGEGIRKRSRNSSTSVHSGPQGVLPMQFKRQGRCARQFWVAKHEHPRHSPIASSRRQLRMSMSAT